jgi:hypothetical protein
MPRAKNALMFDRKDLLEQIQASDYLTQILLPEKYVFPLFRPVEVSILIVTDASGGFDGRSFGLAELLNVLAVAPGPWVRFVVTTAHRNNDASAALKNFRFDAEDLTQYDEIWLFGVERQPSYLSDPELKAIAQFMAGGGGVFATGDHEDLGAGLCSRVPRVRNMRMWYWPSPGPNGEPVAPKVDTATRHDTLTRRGAETIVFDHQSDDVPQEILPVMYTRPISILRQQAYPHPVLCGPRGIIRHMPDHPHEGQCYEPTDLDRTFTFSGTAFTEYPVAADGTKPAPQVIAQSHHAHRNPTDVKGSLNAKTFGSIGVYEGHKANIGRILVDSTWHHFFNINLTGNPGSSDPRAVQGFYGSAAGLDVYKDIKAYFRNIAVYLARPAQIVAMRNRALWWARFEHRIAMDLRLDQIKQWTGTDRLVEYIRIGTVARDVLGLLASRCQIIQWVFDIGKLPILVREFIPPLDPVETFKPRGPLPPPELIDILEPALLGAAIYGAALEVRGFQDRAPVERLGDKGLAEIFNRYSGEALQLSIKHVQDTMEQGRSFMAGFERGLR